MPPPGFLLSQERRDGYECLHFASELTGVSGLPRSGSRIQCGMTEWEIGMKDGGQKEPGSGQGYQVRYQVHTDGYLAVRKQGTWAPCVALFKAPFGPRWSQ
jgi:hypothetical protein